MVSHSRRSRSPAARYGRGACTLARAERLLVPRARCIIPRAYSHSKQSAIPSLAFLAPANGQRSAVCPILHLKHKTRIFSCTNNCQKLVFPSPIKVPVTSGRFMSIWIHTLAKHPLTGPQFGCPPPLVCWPWQQFLVAHLYSSIQEEVSVSESKH